MLFLPGRGFRVSSKRSSRKTRPIKREARSLRKPPLKCVLHFGFGQ